MAISLYRYFFFIAIYCVPRSLKNLECSLIDLLSAFLLKKLRAAGNWELGMCFVVSVV